MAKDKLTFFSFLLGLCRSLDYSEFHSGRHRAARSFLSGLLSLISLRGLRRGKESFLYLFEVASFLKTVQLREKQDNNPFFLCEFAGT